ncbi:MAG: type VI secretion system tip protein TssI/VgrG, partial [Planctomycetota bacterium]
MSLDLPGGKKRYFTGLVSRFEHIGVLGRRAHYRAVVKPWLWFLTRTANCRIFQEMTVPDILMQVFRDRGFTDVEDTLNGNYRLRDYCVQYRETDFNFVSRLMEQEGIYYYFRHDAEKHQLVLADSPSSHDPFPGYPDIQYLPPSKEVGYDREYIDHWTNAKEVQPGVFAYKDFDMQKPKANLEVKATILQGHEKADFEYYDYPGDYTDIAHGEADAKKR